jgi:hypothetical protein
MAKYDPADNTKVETQVLAMMEAAKIAGKTTVFFNTKTMFNALKFSKMTRNQFTDQVCEQLTGSSFHKKWGDWVACEYECEIWVLYRLAAPGDLQSINDEGRNLFYNTETQIKRKAKNRHVLNLDIPEGMDAKTAERLVQETFAAFAPKQ